MIFACCDASFSVNQNLWYGKPVRLLAEAAEYHPSGFLTDLAVSMLCVVKQSIEAMRLRFFAGDSCRDCLQTILFRL
jgi:hypothetical protein